MHKIACLLASAALLTAAPAATALAQEPATMTVNGTTITVGGGAQLLSLPDMRFTFFTNNDGAVVKKQKNSDLDDYGGAVVGSIETPFGYWGGMPVTGVVSGFFANVEDTDRKHCFSTGSLECEVENIVDNPNQLDSIGYDNFTTKTKRDVDYWGAGGEVRFGKGAEPVPDSGGYMFRFAYFGIGGDVRGIDQDNKLKLFGDGPNVAYSETLDTTYAGAYLSIGGEYNILGYLGMGQTLGIRSLLNLRAGIYNADTGYNGRYNASNGDFGRRGLSDDKVAFIGAASFETRKPIQPAHLTLVGHRLRVLLLRA